MSPAQAPPARRARVELRLAATAASVPHGRRHAMLIAREHLDEQTLGDFELLISEVLTNAVRHGAAGRAGEVLLALTPKDGYLCVQVTDEGKGFVPVPRATAPDDVGGFGLFLVERLTRRWGMTREDGRTRVWFEMDCSADAVA